MTNLRYFVKIFVRRRFVVVTKIFSGDGEGEKSGKNYKI